MVKRCYLRTFLAVLAIVTVSSWTSAADRPQSDAFDAKGVKLRYFVEGKGEPVVFVHGFGSSAEINWIMPGLFDAVAKDRRAIAVDFPGHGASEKPEKEEAYGDRLVEDVVLLLDHLKIAKAHIVGYSMGGMVAVKMLAKHPERTLSGTLGGMGWLKEGGMLQKRVFERSGGENSNSAMALCFRGMGKLAVTEDELKSIKVPVEMVVGDRDPCRQMYVVPARNIRKDWPVVEIAGAGHMNCITKQQFRDEVVKWIAKQSER